MQQYSTPDKNIIISNIDVMKVYDSWGRPTVIISDGPYGIKGFPGDLPTNKGLEEWYEPHIKKWSEKSLPNTTLWFWNTELGWATVHPILIKNGWRFINCHVWDKGIAHIAGNSNTKSLRKLPVVTEVCVQYVKEPVFKVGNQELSMKEWLRHEWQRTGLSFSTTNKAAGVKDAATRKYFTKCHLWYSPPSEVFEKIVNYANKYGKIEGKPYFSINGKKPMSKIEWKNMRPKFKCPIGITNVWNLPPLNGKERIKNGSKSLHLNQKPLKLMKLMIEITSDSNDLVWDPFAGLASTAIACHSLKRRCVSAEVNSEIFDAAVKRFKNYVKSNDLV